jgi:hypothetical protein
VIVVVVEAFDTMPTHAGPEGEVGHVQLTARMGENLPEALPHLIIVPIR